MLTDLNLFIVILPFFVDFKSERMSYDMNSWVM